MGARRAAVPAALLPYRQPGGCGHRQAPDGIGLPETALRARRTEGGQVGARKHLRPPQVHRAPDRRRERVDLLCRHDRSRSRRPAGVIRARRPPGRVENKAVREIACAAGFV